MGLLSALLDGLLSSVLSSTLYKGQKKSQLVDFAEDLKFEDSFEKSKTSEILRLFITYMNQMRKMEM